MSIKGVLTLGMVALNCAREWLPPSPCSHWAYRFAPEYAYITMMWLSVLKKSTLAQYNGFIFVCLMTLFTFWIIWSHSGHGPFTCHAGSSVMQVIKFCCKNKMIFYRGSRCWRNLQLYLLTTIHSHQEVKNSLLTQTLEWIEKYKMFVSAD